MRAIFVKLVEMMRDVLARVRRSTHILNGSKRPGPTDSAHKHAPHYLRDDMLRHSSPRNIAIVLACVCEAGNMRWHFTTTQEQDMQIL